MVDEEREKAHSDVEYTFTLLIYNRFNIRSWGGFCSFGICDFAKRNKLALASIKVLSDAMKVKR